MRIRGKKTTYVVSRYGRLTTLVAVKQLMVIGGRKHDSVQQSCNTFGRVNSCVWWVTLYDSKRPGPLWLLNNFNHHIWIIHWIRNPHYLAKSIWREAANCFCHARAEQVARKAPFSFSEIPKTTLALGLFRLLHKVNLSTYLVFSFFCAHNQSLTEPSAELFSILI